MWCLETIVDINQKLAQGKNLKQAYRDCGIYVPPERHRPAPVVSQQDSFPLKESDLKELEETLRRADETKTASEAVEAREGTEVSQ